MINRLKAIQAHQDLGLINIVLTELSKKLATAPAYQHDREKLQECIKSISQAAEQLDEAIKFDFSVLKESAVDGGITTLSKFLGETTLDEIQQELLQRFPDIRAAKTMASATVKDLLLELEERGGSFAVIAEASLLVLKKSEDYNKDSLDADGTDSSKRDVYFPFGTLSYVQMIHVKAQRMVSLSENLLAGKKVNFEGIDDSALDMINYCSFLVEHSRRVQYQEAVKTVIAEGKK